MQRYRTLAEMPEGSPDNGTGTLRDHPLDHTVRAGELRARRQDDLAHGIHTKRIERVKNRTRIYADVTD